MSSKRKQRTLTDALKQPAQKEISMAHNQLPVNRTEYDGQTQLLIQETKSGDLLLEVGRAGRELRLTLNDQQTRQLYDFLTQRFGK